MIADLPSNASGLLRRPRFSLRALFVVTTAVAVICTYIVLPSITANRFLAAIADKNFVTADSFFRNPSDKFLEEWADKKWAFQVTADLAPWSFGQIFCGQREVVVRVDFFEFDQNASCTANVAAGSLGLGPPTVSPVSYGSKLIDAADRTTNLRK